MRGMRFLAILWLVLVCLLLLRLRAAPVPASGGSAEGGTVLCVAVDEANPDVVYAGTWAGLYRSTDAGSQWSLVNLPFSDPIFTLVWDSGQSRMVAGGAGRLFVADSTGSSWVMLRISVDGAPPVTSILLHPEDPALLFAGTTGRGLFRSDDGGSSWAGVKPGTENSERPGVMDVVDIAREPSSGTVFVATRDGLFRAASGRLARVDYDYNTAALAVQPHDLVLYSAVGGEIRYGVPIPSMYGTTIRWNDLRAVGTVPYIIDLCFDAGDPSTLWAGTKSGMYRGRFEVDSATNEQAIAWTKVGEIDDRIGWVSCPAIEPETIVAGGTSGVWRSADAGDTWVSSNAGMQAVRFLDVAVVPGAPATIFGVTLDSGPEGEWVRVLRAADFGATWELSFEDRDYNPFYPGNPRLAFDPRPPNPGILYLDGRLASTDLGETWTPRIPFADPGTPGGFYIDPANANNQAVYAYYEAYPHFPPVWYVFARVTADGWQTYSELWGGGGPLLRTDPHSSRSLYFSLGYPSGIHYWDAATGV